MTIVEIGVLASLALNVGIGAGMEVGALVWMVWDDPTIAIFGAIIGFWFGNRAIRHNVDTSYATLPVVKPVAEFKK